MILGLPQKLAREVEFVFFHARLANLLALSFQECISHSTTDEERVHFAHQVLDYGDLVADFGPAEDGDERLLGMLQRFAQVAQFLFHKKSGGRFLHELCDANRRSVGTMRSPEGIVHVEVSKTTKLLG